MTEVLRVQEPGLFTTVQDLGRPNAISSGVPPGGAMDRFAHSAANLLVGNEVGAASLEGTLGGPRLIAEHSCLIAVTGADHELLVNGEPAPMWASLFLGPGDELRFGARRSGGRVYIAVAGGIVADRWLGSLATNVMAGRGGMHGRTLQSGDVITIATERSGPAVSGRELPAHVRPEYGDHTLRVIAGPHMNRLGDGREILFGSSLRVSRDADRMGYRLEGVTLATSGEELLSFGLTAGALQVPRGGQPILLMADHQTAGGYPVVAVVVSASMAIGAQLVPGDDVRFEEISIDAALRMRKARRDALDSLRS
jgi:antagonist of KipI